MKIIYKFFLLIWNARDKQNRDLFLFGLLLVTAFSGLLILYSASAFTAFKETGDADYYIKKQMIWFLAGSALMFLAAFIPVPLLRKFALPGMIVSLFLLLLVFIPGIGRSVSSSKESFQRWISLGPVSFQPSEFVKIAIIIYTAHILSRNDRLLTEYDFKKLMYPALLILAVLIAILLEPQYGTTMSILLIIITLLYISGFPLIRLILLFLSLLPLLAIMIYFWEYRFVRLKVWFDPYAYRHEGGYQLVTAFRAFREGGIAGEDGLAAGFAHRYLTYGHTDFVLALYAENFGLIGIILLFLLFNLLLWKGIMILRSVEDPFVFMLGTGVLLMLILQTVLNVCVVTGLIPTTGISLPFISYGGSSLITSLILGGLLVNCSRYSLKQHAIISPSSF